MEPDVAEAIRKFGIATEEIVETFAKLSETLQKIDRQFQQRIYWEQKEQEEAMAREKAIMRWQLVPTQLEHGYLIETPQVPNTSVPKRVNPQAIMQADFNHWYAMPHDKSVNKDGYIVSRLYVSHLMQMRWFCTCPYFNRVQTTTNPICKHIVATRQEIQHDPQYFWTQISNAYDLCRWFLTHAHQFGGWSFLYEAIAMLTPAWEETAELTKDAEFLEVLAKYHASNI